MDQNLCAHSWRVSQGLVRGVVGIRTVLKISETLKVSQRRTLIQRYCNHLLSLDNVLDAASRSELSEPICSCRSEKPFRECPGCHLGGSGNTTRFIFSLIQSSRPVRPLEAATYTAKSSLTAYFLILTPCIPGFQNKPGCLHR